MDKTLRKELTEAIEKAMAIIENRWDEVQEDENCSEAADVLQMLLESLEDDGEGCNVEGSDEEESSVDGCNEDGEED